MSLNFINICLGSVGSVPYNIRTYHPARPYACVASLRRYVTKRQ